MEQVWVLDADRYARFWVVTPDRYGMIINDGFPMMHGPARWQTYAQGMLRAVYERTGQYIVIMVLPHGSFKND